MEPMYFFVVFALGVMGRSVSDILSIILPIFPDFPLAGGFYTPIFWMLYMNCGRVKWVVFRVHLKKIIPGGIICRKKGFSLQAEVFWLLHSRMRILSRL